MLAATFCLGETWLLRRVCLLHLCSRLQQCLASSQCSVQSGDTCDRRRFWRTANRFHGNQTHRQGPSPFCDRCSLRCLVHRDLISLFTSSRHLDQLMRVLHTASSKQRVGVWASDPLLRTNRRSGITTEASSAASCGQQVWLRKRSFLGLGHVGVALFRGRGNLVRAFTSGRLGLYRIWPRPSSPACLHLWSIRRRFFQRSARTSPGGRHQGQSRHCHRHCASTTRRCLLGDRKRIVIHRNVGAGRETIDILSRRNYWVRLRWHTRGVIIILIVAANPR
mmetsp:Transcript_39882/g.105800  ORF Transcript_39882/g.105800 Transcript_39882/m.105800 type:complete len:279 (+) Transcript_39882:847-1683(+)